MNDPSPPTDGSTEDIRAALHSRLRIAIDYAVRAMRISDSEQACTTLTRLSEEVAKAKRLAEEWNGAPTLKRVR
jgi:hypothetical protein